MKVTMSLKYLYIIIDGEDYVFPLKRMPYVILNIYNVLLLVRQAYEEHPDRICTHSIALGFHHGYKCSIQISIFDGSIYYSIIKRGISEEDVHISNSGILYEDFLNFTNDFAAIVKEYNDYIKEVEE